MSAAIKTFAVWGYYGTSTMDVVKVAGISQGYLYRLFPDKDGLFAALIDHCSNVLREAAAAAVAKVATTDQEAVFAALSSSYEDVIADRDVLMILMHGNCTAVEPVIGEAVRACYAKQVKYIGASDGQLRRYFADALLGNVVLAVGADTVDTPWARMLRG
ncbi:TetR/AcrR family transcriptional regulator [Streptomyces sp. NPDC085931]|uniref:TetR/AcrR family transcriptional regulator n=1 Tax=Streptomyces sp. NPDC085931 TaxID=3365740 RepID=UPI0037D68919